VMDNNQKPAAQPVYAVDEIDLRELFGILWAEKKLIAAITGVAAVLSVILSLVMTEIYTADTTLVAADTEQNSNGLAGQLGGAATLLGVNIGGNGVEKVNTAIAILRSRQFIGRFIDDNNLLVPLFAGIWDKSTRSSLIDRNIYDIETASWRRETGAPTDQEAYEKFRGALGIVGPDIDTGIVNVSFSWHNPAEAASWLNGLISALNQEIRTRDVREANDAITFLQGQLNATQFVDLQRVFYQLIESQTRITMLADVREEYVFRVIDPAAVPDRRSAPRRSFISVLGTLVGFVFALFSVYLRRSLSNAK
jgi:uncharacterized protein involved in exopolysaccharide biosynthesis